MRRESCVPKSITGDTNHSIRAVMVNLEFTSEKSIGRHDTYIYFDECERFYEYKGAGSGFNSILCTIEELGLECLSVLGGMLARGVMACFQVYLTKHESR